MSIKFMLHTIFKNVQIKMPAPRPIFCLFPTIFDVAESGLERMDYPFNSLPFTCQLLAVYIVGAPLARALGEAIIGREEQKMAPGKGYTTGGSRAGVVVKLTAMCLLVLAGIAFLYATS